MAEENRRFADKFALRMPDGMRDKIAAVAEANNRSMNAEIVARLEASLRGECQSTRTVDQASDLEKLQAQVRALESKLNAIPADQLRQFSELMQKLDRGEVVTLANST